MIEKAERLHRAIDVWRRQDSETLVRYRCFEVIPLGKFCIQSKDFYQAPFGEKACLDLDHHFMELLVEASPDLRGGLYDLLEEAIRGHEEDFWE